MARLLELEPAMRMTIVKSLGPFRRAEHFAIFAEGLRKAGMPE